MQTLNSINSLSGGLIVEVILEIFLLLLQCQTRWLERFFKKKSLTGENDVINHLISIALQKCIVIRGCLLLDALMSLVSLLSSTLLCIGRATFDLKLPLTKRPELSMNRAIATLVIVTCHKFVFI